MPLPDIIQDLNFLKDSDDQGVKQLAVSCEVVTLNEGENFTTQFAPSKSFYLLLNGAVEFSIQLENENDRFKVGTSNEKLTPLGWSGFRSPYRYATTDIALTACKALKWEHNELRKVFDQYPELGTTFLKYVIEHALQLLTDVRKELSNYHITDFDLENLNEEGGQKSRSDNTPNLLDLLRRSPFFEIFSDNMLTQLAYIGKKKRYSANQVIVKQGEDSDGFYILAHGKVSLNFNVEDVSGHKLALMRNLSNEGYTVCWTGGLHNQTNDITAVSLQETVVYRIPKEELLSILGEFDQFQLAFNYRLLWLIGNQLRSARSRLISQKYEKEILAIKNLLEQNSTQLEVSSKLHKVPHLLNSILTLDDAFDCLKEVRESGNTLEKGLATLCLDILGDVNDEKNFYKSLVNVYESVVNSPKNESSKEIRIKCAQKFQDAFEHTRHIIDGWDNLPDTPGHIFIYNHLANHPYNTLPNNFQLTLDSHFISSKILFEKYGDPGMRVVRVSRNVEYGHQYYYERLGHINVYTPESEKVKESPEEKAKRKGAFYEEAGAYLKNGVNLMISPEGTSRMTHESPGQLKGGAFLLAASLNPEPLIVPISVANFDKRLSHNVFSATIHVPIELSRVLNDKRDKSEIFAYLETLQGQYKHYVQQTVKAAKEYRQTLSQSAILQTEKE